MQQSEADLTILEQFETEPCATYSFIAEQLGVVLGTINWHMKKLI